MTPDRSDAITRDRFRDWAKVLKRNVATPVLTLAVSHDPPGTIHLVQIQDMPHRELVAFLESALVELIRKGGGR